MKGPVYDYENGEYIYSTSDDLGMSSDGHMMMRMSDDMAMDMDTGELHMVSGWDRDDDDQPD